MPDFRIFDIHQHVQEHIPDHADGTYDRHLYEIDRDFRLGAMDDNGVRAGAILASLLYERPYGVADTRRMNNYVAWYRDQNRYRWPVAVGTVEPIFGADAGIAEIERMVGELGMDGCVWHHHFAGVGIDDRRMTPFLQTLALLGKVAFIHVRGYSHETTFALETLAKRVPECTIVTLCPMNGLQQMRELRGVGERCPNIMFNTSLLWPLNHWVDTFASWFGSERIIFGTDLHYHAKRGYSRPPGLDDILNSEDLTEQDKRNILWDNAQRLFPQLKALD